MPTITLTAPRRCIAGMISLLPFPTSRQESQQSGDCAPTMMDSHFRRASWSSTARYHSSRFPRHLSISSHRLRHAGHDATRLGFPRMLTTPAPCRLILVDVSQDASSGGLLADVSAASRRQHDSAQRASLSPSTRHDDANRRRLFQLAHAPSTLSAGVSPRGQHAAHGLSRRPRGDEAPSRHPRSAFPSPRFAIGRHRHYRGDSADFCTGTPRAATRMPSHQRKRMISVTSGHHRTSRKMR